MEERTHGVIWHNPDSFFHYNGWPSVAKDNEGTLYVVFSGFRAAHICPFGKTVLCKSWDDGKTWSAPIIVNDTYLDDRDAGVVCLGGKKILVSWFAHPVSEYTTTYSGAIRNSWAGSASVLDQYGTIPPEKGMGGSFVRVSNDGGLTWGPTVKLPVNTPHGPILKKDGSLLYLGKEHYSYGEETPHVVSAWESRDDGMTWQKLGEVPLPSNSLDTNMEPHSLELDCFHEPHAVELDDGTILGVVRAQGKEVDFGFTMYQTISTDGGKTWSEMAPMHICGSPPHLIKHSSGAVILVYGRRAEPFGERAIISKDGGKTWSDEITLCETTPCDLGYPASVELSDGSILTVYYQQYENEGFPSILYTKWKL